MHEGFNTHRLKDNPEEERFASAWRGMQSGRVLDWLLSGANQRGYPTNPATERDEAVAATVMQWLGSPVGQGFLRDLGYERGGKKS